MPRYNGIVSTLNNSRCINTSAHETCVLSLSSSNEEIRKYFTAILKLSKSDNEFPVNLNEVYPLAYARKQAAVRALLSNELFIEGEDYKTLTISGEGADSNVLTKNGENLKGGRPTTEYYLSVPCLEYFIARKVRPVFEVYRQVFHKTTDMIVESKTEQPKAIEKESISKVKRLEEEIEWLNKRLRMTKAALDQETKLKCSCFSYLIETKQYDKWEEFRSENTELHRQIEKAKQLLNK